MKARQTLTVLLLVASGLVAGIVISDRMSARQPAPSESASDQARGRMPGQIGGLATLPDLTAVAERALKASVNISSTQQVAVDPWFTFMWGGDQVRSQTSRGSGVMVSADGYVLTNSHVIGDLRADIRVTLADDVERPATIVGVDELTDLAVVKIEGNGFSTLPWGDSDALRVAEWVVAVGNPFSFNQTVTVGVVSALRHNARLPAAAYRDFIQTDAAINPGNSGGALVNSRGELVGINTLIYSQTGGYQGIGFAVPSVLARRIMDQLVDKGEVVRGSIGNLTLRTLEPALARRAGLGDARGVIVENMYRNDPAYRAGIVPDDVIVRYNGAEVADETQLSRLIAETPIGKTVRVDVMRSQRGRWTPVSVDVPVVQMRLRR
jgi:serine protease Do